MTRPTGSTGLQAERSALVVIDVQTDVVDGAVPVRRTEAALPAIERLLAVFSAAGRPIAHAVTGLRLPRARWAACS